MKSKIIFLLLVLVSLVILVTSPVNAISTGVEFTKETKTAVIKDNDILISELENIQTVQSLTSFMTEFRYKTYEKLTVPKDSSYSFLAKTFQGSDIKITDFQLLTRVNNTYENITETCKPYTVPDENITIKVISNCTTTKKYYVVESSVWTSTKFDGIVFEPNQDYYFRVFSERPATLGIQLADVSPTIAGYDLTDYFVWWNTSWTYCDNIELNNIGLSRTEWYVDTYINTTSLTKQPYDDSIRVVNAPCNTGGQEISSSMYNVEKNTTGRIQAMRLVFNMNGTVTTRLNYSIYYDSLPKGNITYMENMSFVGTGVNFTARWNNSIYGNVYIGFNGGVAANASTIDKNYTRTAAGQNVIKLENGTNQYGWNDGLTTAVCGGTVSTANIKIIQCNTTIAGGIGYALNITVYSRVPNAYYVTDLSGSLANIVWFGYAQDVSNELQYRNIDQTFTIAPDSAGANYYTSGLVTAYITGKSYGWGWAWKNGTSRSNF